MNEPDESSAFSVSIRAWLAIMLVSTVCAIAIADTVSAFRSQTGIAVQEPLYSMALLALGFYFGQKTPDKPT